MYLCPFQTGNKSSQEYNLTRDLGGFILSIWSPFSLQTEIDGLTGRVKYDNMGRRAYFFLDLIELTMTGLQKVRFWNNTIKKHIDLTQQN